MRKPTSAIVKPRPTGFEVTAGVTGIGNEMANSAIPIARHGMSNGLKKRFLKNDSCLGVGVQIISQGIMRL